MELSCVLRKVSMALHLQDVALHVRTVFLFLLLRSPACNLANWWFNFWENSCCSNSVIQILICWIESYQVLLVLSFLYLEALIKLDSDRLYPWLLFDNLLGANTRSMHFDVVEPTIVVLLLHWLNRDDISSISFSVSGIKSLLTFGYPFKLIVTSIVFQFLLRILTVLWLVGGIQEERSRFLILNFYQLILHLLSFIIFKLQFYST